MIQVGRKEKDRGSKGNPFRKSEHADQNAATQLFYPLQKKYGGKTQIPMLKPMDASASIFSLTLPLMPRYKSLSGPNAA
ncbi:MAG TPA: hypothetical protein VH369_11640, partial [Bryobacteraceae bacterium]